MIDITINAIIDMIMNAMMVCVIGADNGGIGDNELFMCEIWDK